MKWNEMKSVSIFVVLEKVVDFCDHLIFWCFGYPRTRCDSELYNQNSSYMITSQKRPKRELFVI